MERICQFSPCRSWRYTLWREWDFDMFDPRAGEKRAKEYLMVIGLNPSTADERQDDPTIRRCIDFAKRWGFGALCMTNLFAWRDTKVENMKAAAQPIGEANDRWLIQCSNRAGLILAAWGTHGSHLRRDTEVTGMISGLHYLRLNADGSPEHPLYVPKLTEPIPLVFQSSTPP